MEEKMAESKTNENVVKMTETGGVRGIAAALQSGVLKLPYSTAFPQKLSEALESRSIETWVRHDKVPVQEVLDGRLMSQFVLPARADGLYLLSLFAVLTEGVPKDTLADLGLTAATE